MKKVLLLIFIVITLTGCNIEKFDKDNIEEVLNIILKDEKNLVNTVSRGYKYYIPPGVRLISSSSYNEKLYYNSEQYYLYVDVISYYHKTIEEYEVNKDAEYSMLIKHNDKYGYLEINKINDKYFVEAMYNYAKIEAYVSERNLKKTILNISYILSSIQFNDSVTELLLARDTLTLGEEIFDIFKPTRDEGTFLEYIKEFDKYEDNNISGELGREN